jgi:hypothetical protein
MPETPPVTKAVLPEKSNEKFIARAPPYRREA